MAKRPSGAKSPDAKPDADASEPGTPVKPATPARSTTPGKSATPGKPAGDVDEQIVRRHLAFGWWSLTVFTALGLLLEAGHGIKLGWYLDLGNATRRLSLTLGHAHGTLLGFLNLAFAFSLRHARMSPVAAARASFALRAVTVLLPLGFLIGGIAFYAGDPGFAIVLVPPSGALLVVALAMVAHGFSSRPPHK
ncbi:MAG TPA: hypothetical protein VHN14_03855 [Kofleriaceae bacterium]|nr:hypothetical protein [Kofleriaceae bacterium]